MGAGSIRKEPYRGFTRIHGEPGQVNADQEKSHHGDTEPRRISSQRVFNGGGYEVEVRL